MNKLIANESGATAIVVALTLTMLLMIAAFAVDFGYLYVVKNEVQNSADAAALSGADVLFRNSVNPANFDDKGGSATTTADCSGTDITEQAACQAAAAIALNEHSTYTFAVNVDSWSNLSPSGPNNFPAVQVNLTRTFVPYFFAKILGYSTTNISASATAMVKSPATVTSPNLLPIAINDCVFSDASGFNARTGQTLTIGTSYPDINCNSMKWTSLGYNVQMGANDIRNIITDGSSAQLGLAPNAPNATSADCLPPGADGINTCINMLSGVKETDIKTMEPYVGNNYAVPVVVDVTAGNQPIQAFACVKLTNVCDSNRYVGDFTGGAANSTECQQLTRISKTCATAPSRCAGNDAYFSFTILDSNCLAGGTGGGPNYGVTSPPQLAD